MWCPECGPSGTVDEDGCCLACGATATGCGARRAVVAQDRANRLTKEMRKLVSETEDKVEKSFQWLMLGIINLLTLLHGHKGHIVLNINLETKSYTREEDEE